MNRKKILIVDDNPVIITTLSMKLKAAGYDVVTATDGSEAVSSVRKEKPHLILLDLSFPPDVAHGGGVPWDGFRIIEWYRRMEEAKDIPVIVITGSEAEKYRERALASGAIGFFQKPVDNEELLNIIKNTISAGIPEPVPAQVEPVAVVPLPTHPPERVSIFDKLNSFFSTEKAKD
jgi:CheY-like chemotaxis protein